eukprot:gene3952-2815_t
MSRGIIIVILFYDYFHSLSDGLILYLPILIQKMGGEHCPPIGSFFSCFRSRQFFLRVLFCFSTQKSKSTTEGLLAAFLEEDIQTPHSFGKKKTLHSPPVSFVHPTTKEKSKEKQSLVQIPLNQALHRRHLPGPRRDAVLTVMPPDQTWIWALYFYTRLASSCMCLPSVLLGSSIHFLKSPFSFSVQQANRQSSNMSRGVKSSESSAVETESVSRSASSSGSDSGSGSSRASSAPKKAPTYKEPVDGNGALILGDSLNLHIGDYVGFERIGTDREWNLALGRVVSFPSAQTVKVVHYDPCNADTVAQDPLTEKEIKKKAQKNGKMNVYNAREKLKKDLLKAVQAENDAARRLFEAREETLRKQQAANSNMSSTYDKLDAVRKSLKEYMHLWCCLRSMIVPPTDMVPVVKALMLVLHEDKAISSWESMREVMLRNDFFKRLMDTDCAVKPMSVERCDRIRELLEEKESRIAKEEKKKEKEGKSHAKQVSQKEKEAQTARKKREEAATARRAKNEAEGKRPLHECGHQHHHGEFEEDIGIMHKLDVSVRRWIEMQIELSAAGEARNAIIDECFSEQQEQRVLLREVNDMRADISKIEEQMKEKKKLILGAKEPLNVLKLEVKDYKVDSLFHRRSYTEYDGRYVHEVILRSAVIINFGALQGCEDKDGYVKLGKKQTEMLRYRVFQSYIVHDADTMEDLLNITDQNEKELAELQARIDELRNKGDLTPEEAEELAQLTAVYEERDRQYRATLARIAHMYACCRGARDITIGEKKNDTKYLRLGLKWFGNWSPILESHKAEMENALNKDLEQVVPVEMLNDLVMRLGQTDIHAGHWRVLFQKTRAAKRLLGKEMPVCDQHLIVNFNIKYTGPLSEQELTHMYYHAAYPNVSSVYEKYNEGQPTYPINTIQQETDCASALGDQCLADLPADFNHSGAGAPSKVEDYNGEDGSAVMHFDRETEEDPDFRKSKVVVVIPRDDFEACTLEPETTVYSYETEAPKQDEAPESLVERIEEKVKEEEAKIEMKEDERKEEKAEEKAEETAEKAEETAEKEEEKAEKAEETAEKEEEKAEKEEETTEKEEEKAEKAEEEGNAPKVELDHNEVVLASG